MTKKQAGFTLVEGLLLLLVVSFISFAGWYVWNAHQKSSVVPASKPVATAPQASKTFSRPEVGFVFSYPVDWETLDKTTDYGFYSLRLRAPGTVVVANMGEEIQSGAQILLLRDRVTLIGDIQKFADDPALGKNLINKKTIKVDGVEALEYDNYDSATKTGLHGVQFYKDNVSYSLTLDINKYASPQYGNVFDGIIKSAKFK